MTRLKPETIICRETAVVHRGRPLVIELHPAYLTIREKGKRKAVRLNYDTARDVAYKILWRQEMADKAKQKAQRARR